MLFGGSCVSPGPGRGDDNWRRPTAEFFFGGEPTWSRASICSCCTGIYSCTIPRKASSFEAFAQLALLVLVCDHFPNSCRSLLPRYTIITCTFSTNPPYFFSTTLTLSLLTASSTNLSSGSPINPQAQNEVPIQHDVDRPCHCRWHPGCSGLPLVPCRAQ